MRSQSELKQHCKQVGAISGEAKKLHTLSKILNDIQASIFSQVWFCHLAIFCTNVIIGVAK